MGQNFLYRANFKIKKKGKRLDFQTLRVFTAGGSGGVYGVPNFCGSRNVTKIEVGFLYTLYTLYTYYIKIVFE